MSPELAQYCWLVYDSDVETETLFAVAMVNVSVAFKYRRSIRTLLRIGEYSFLK